MMRRSKRMLLAARETRLAWIFMGPALAVLFLIATGPLLATVWESLHGHDLRLPWLGRPFIGLTNYQEAATDPRFREALEHTLAFTLLTVSLELILGLTLALGLDGLTRGRGLACLVVLLPWALPTVVAGLVWRFIFDNQSGLANAAASRLGMTTFQLDWLADPKAAWIPIVLGDVWKTTPFVALLLLAGLQGIDPRLFEAARMDGAGKWRRFVDITLPLLAPALIVALVFRTLDAFRVFDLVYVLTGGGPGTSTEVISLYAFLALMQDLRFGYASALSVAVFFISLILALLYLRAARAAVVQQS
jgi:ABC-type sugar transport system permease subunit